MQKNNLQQIFNQITFTGRRTHNDTSCLEIESYVTSYFSLRTDTCGWYLKNLAFLENQSADATKKNDKFYFKLSWSQTNLSIETVAFLRIDCFAESLV